MTSLGLVLRVCGVKLSNEGCAREGHVCCGEVQPIRFVLQTHEVLYNAMKDLLHVVNYYSEFLLFMKLVTLMVCLSYYI